MQQQKTSKNWLIKWKWENNRLLKVWSAYTNSTWASKQDIIPWANIVHTVGTIMLAWVFFAFSFSRSILKLGQTSSSFTTFAGGTIDRSTHQMYVPTCCKNGWATSRVRSSGQYQFRGARTKAPCFQEWVSSEGSCMHAINTNLGSISRRDKYATKLLIIARGESKSQIFHTAVYHSSVDDWLL